LAIPPSHDSSALGAARIAAHTLGWWALGAGGEQALAPGSIVQPVEADHERYRERLALFREAAATTMPLVHRLQRLQP